MRVDVVDLLRRDSGIGERVLHALRRGEPPVIARIEKDACCLDPRTVLKGEDETLLDAVEAAVKSVGVL